jgi:ATP-dependent exoDNAse (exonuclease V) beta subunit
VLENAPGVERHTLIAERQLPVKLQLSVEVTAACAEEKDGKENKDEAERVEAEWIASRILELRRSLTIGDNSRPAEFRDMAVLMRKAAMIGPLAEAFDRFGVQYQVTRQVGFFESREIRDLTHLLRAISNPRDEVSLAVVLRSPLVGLSDEGLIRLKGARDNLASALEAEVTDLDPLDDERWRRFRGNFARWRSSVHHVPADRVLTTAMADCRFNWTPGSAVGTNVEKLLALARNAPASQSLAEFVHEIKLIREEEAREADAPFDEALDAVRVITAHASKGLEFPIVFIPGMQSRPNMTLPSLTYTTEGGFGTKWRNPTGGEAIADWFRAKNKAVIRDRELQEANRLLYVAMTRAEEHLVLSYAGETDKPKHWAEPVFRVYELASVQPDAPARVINDALVRVISKTPPALRLEREGAFAGRVAEMTQPEEAAQQESNVTVTALTMFADCPRRYYLARYLGWETGPPSGAKDNQTAMSSSELGKQVHALLASQTVESPDFQALHLADTFDRSELGRRARKAKRVEHEFDFMLAIDEMVVRGQIDLWFEDRAGQVIVDYKTDDVGAGEVQARAAAYDTQLRYYALAVEKMTGALPAEAWLHFLRPDVAVQVRLNAAGFDAARELVAEMASAQRSLRFPLKEGAHCTRCPFYRGKCPAGSQG